MADRIAGDEVRGQFVDDGGDHRVEICDLVMQLEVTAGEGFEADAIGEIHVAIGGRSGRHEASVRTSCMRVRLRS